MPVFCCPAAMMARKDEMEAEYIGQWMNAGGEKCIRVDEDTVFVYFDRSDVPEEASQEKREGESACLQEKDMQQMSAVER